MPIRIVCMVLVLAFGVMEQANAAKRVALVIGNGAYEASPLRNPVNDAKDIGAALDRLGFDVSLLENGTKRDMKSAIRDFGASLADAEIRLFYFAGHGMQVDGENYLIPVKTDIQAENEVEFESVNANRILAKFQSAGPGVNIIILDACRNNPFARSFRSGHRGLARMDAPTGSLMVYATAPGSVAEDGTGRNGLFTEHLLNHLEKENVPLDNVLRNVRREVVHKSNGRQIPWAAESLLDEVVLNIVEKPAPEPVVVATPAPEKEKPAPVQVAALVPAKVSAPSVAISSNTKTWREPNTGMEFVRVQGGCFDMGTTEGKGDEEPVHEVCVDGFWIGRYEVTQAQWNSLMGFNPSLFVGDDRPVDSVTWIKAREFTKTLTAKGEQRFRLPTEAEWEYAARSGGKAEVYSGSDNVKDVAWFNVGNKGTANVGSLGANGLGLHDMSGNVKEWCEDWYVRSGYEDHGRTNPLNDDSGRYRVLRGGGFDSKARDVRSFSRDKLGPKSGRMEREMRTMGASPNLLMQPMSGVGFRVVMSD